MVFPKKSHNRQFTDIYQNIDGENVKYKYEKNTDKYEENKMNRFFNGNIPIS